MKNVTPMDLLDWLSQHHQETVYFHRDREAQTTSFYVSSGMFTVPLDLWDKFEIALRMFRPDVNIEVES